VYSLARQAIIPPTASPRGEEELVPKAVKRGGYLPIPRRDTRAGEWELATHQRSWIGHSGPSVYTRVNSDEQSVKQSARSGMVQPAARRNDKAVGVRDPGQGKNKQGLGASGAEWRSVGRQE